MGNIIYKANIDPDYQDVYVDVDEIRTRTAPDGQELTYRYIHGGFRAMSVKFSLHFPEKDAFKGRFFQYLSPFPGPDEEMLSISKTDGDDIISFSILNGAYFVESNMGSANRFGPNGDDTVRWKSSAAVAEFSRKKAIEIYGCARPVGIVFGGSGGGYKTMACIENTDAWEGAVPYVIGSPVSLPNTITMHVQGERVLRNAFGKILDSIDAGGSGDMYAGLSEDEAFMLRELTDMGFPPPAWYPEARGQFNEGSLPVLSPGVKRADPSYFEEFWTVPGYLGADSKSNACRDRINMRAMVKRIHLPGAPVNNDEPETRNGVDDAWKKMLADAEGAWLELDALPEGDDLYLQGVNLTFLTGEAAGKQLLMGNIRRDKVAGGIVTIGMSYGTADAAEVLSMVNVGDELMLDNSDYIAIQSYYRHQVPADLSFHAWDQFRNADGTPSLPQRSFVMGYGFTGTGTVQDGNIHAKTILIQCLMDESTCPWCGDWYRGKVRESKGNEDDFRIYYMQRCMHGDVAYLGNNMVVNYKAALLQALLDMADWLQLGKKPAKSTVYERIGSQIIEEADPAKRYGMQPDVKLTAGGSKCAHVKCGEEFTLTAEITVPEGMGEITSVRYDFNDSWSYPEPPENLFPIVGKFTPTVNGGLRGAVSMITHRFDKPGTYFASVRITSQRTGDADDPFTQIQNLDRVRIIVE